MAGFNRSGVPWYAAGNTLPIRPRTLPELPGHVLGAKASKAAAYQYLHKYFRENWNTGDKFTLTEPAVKYDLYDLLHPEKSKKYLDCEWITWTGIFIEKRDCGQAYYIYVQFDDVLASRSIGPRFGMFSFYHLAEKVV